MNMPFRPALTAVRTADLGSAHERERIAEFVRKEEGRTPFHLPEWSIAVAAGCRQRSHYLIAERGAEITGVLPLTEVRSTLFGRALVSAGFAVGGGALGEAAAELTGAAWQLAERLGCPTLELRGGVFPEGEPWAIDRSTYVGFSRPLGPDDAAELVAIPRKQRAEVRRALGGETTVTVGAGRDDLAQHYAVYSESVRNLGTPVFPRALFREVLHGLGEAADILTVHHDGAAVASVLSLYMDGTVFPYWGGGTQAARALRANDRMYFALMGHARSRGCTRFDFGRSKVGTGAAAFKKNWGFDPEPLGYAVRVADGAAPRSVNPLDPRYQRKVAAWQKLPLWLANRLGPTIARGLG